MKRLLAIGLAFLPLLANAVTFTGEQISPTEWLYTLTYDPEDNYAVCPVGSGTAVIELNGLSGVVEATPPSSTDIATVTTDNEVIRAFTSVNLAWVPEVLNGGRVVRWTHIGPGTGNWSVPIKVFGFRVVTAQPKESAPVHLATDGFSIDVIRTTGCPVQPQDDRDVAGTVVGPTGPEAPEIAIDILPGVYPNAINLRSNTKIPVAILSTPDFNAPTSVAPSTLRFGRAGNEPSFAGGVRIQDVNDDGLPDLVCLFNLQIAGFRVGDTQGILTVVTPAALFEAADSVAVLPAPRSFTRSDVRPPAMARRGRR